MNKWVLSSCLVLSVFTMVACANYPERPGNTANAPTPGAAVQNALQTAPGRLAIDNSNRLHVERRIADKVVQTGYVEKASVLVLGDTAYIGVVQKPGVHRDMSVSTKSHLARIIKGYNNRIKMVYISANPDVYSHFQNFASEISQGRPVRGLWNNFRSIVIRAWPTAR